VRAEQTYTMDPANPLSASLRTRTVRRYRRGDWDTVGTTDLELTASRTMFHLKGRMDIREGTTVVASQDFAVDIPRDLV
jgi:hypothetical protein